MFGRRWLSQSAPVVNMLSRCSCTGSMQLCMCIYLMCSRWHCRHPKQWYRYRPACMQLMAQPPFDSEMGDYYILHYTYGNEFNNDGNMVLGERHAVRYALLLAVSLGSA